MEAMLQRVLKVATSRFHYCSMASSTMTTPRITRAYEQSCWKMTFLIFPRYSNYSMWVRWANLQPSNVKFLRDLVCQKWSKSVHFWRNYSKNKNVNVFWTQCINYEQRVWWYVRCSLYTEFSREHIAPIVQSVDAITDEILMRIKVGLVIYDSLLHNRSLDKAFSRLMCVLHDL